LADHPGGDLHVLLAQRRDDVARGHAELRDPIGVEPHAHAVVAGAEQRDVAHALDAREHVAHLEERVVADVELVVAPARRDHVDHEQQVG
jgi:hypothetical protein